MGYSMHHTRARLIFRYKENFVDGEVIELKAWEVPQSAAKPEGLKYSMVYIGANGRRILGYDNAEGKGHHRHLGDDETPFEFEGIEVLRLKFLGEVSALRGRQQ
jgi:hypothetical protein